MSANDVFLYPNPTKDKITLSFNKGIEADFSVFNLLGKLVIYQPNISISQSHIMDISKLNSGVYFIRINSDAGTVTKKDNKKLKFYFFSFNASEKLIFCEAFFLSCSINKLYGFFIKTS